jgi:hypothetical protein
VGTTKVHSGSTDRHVIPELDSKGLREFGLVTGGVYRAWMRLALLLSRITTPLVLGIVYFLVLTPTAVVMRLMGKDPMARRFDKNAKSYRIRSEKPSKDQMERPF